eukprot:1197816-Pleurochrysis_carterae.AAC.1
MAAAVTVAAEMATAKAWRRRRAAAPTALTALRRPTQRVLIRQSIAPSQRPTRRLKPYDSGCRRLSRRGLHFSRLHDVESCEIIRNRMVLDGGGRWYARRYLSASLV